MQRLQAGSAVAICLFVASLVTADASAAVRNRVEAGAFAPLHAPVRSGVKLEIRNVPLVERAETIVVEEFDVLAPGAVIEVFDGNGKPTRVTPQPMRQFRGMVAGDPSSIVYLSITRGTRMDGIVISRDRKFSLWSAGAGRPVPREGSEKNDVFIEEITAGEEEAPFTCDVEGMAVTDTPQGLPKSLATSELNVKPNAAPTGTQRTVLNLAIETDSALYANFSSNIANVETFARNLVAATSTIYMRDLNTEIRIPYLGLHTTTDVFTVNPGQTGTWNGVSNVAWDTFHALMEFGDRWHNNPPSTAPRSAAALLSGQSQTSGIAWIQRVCLGDFACTTGSCGAGNNAHWGGAYSYNGGIGLSASNRVVPDPNALEHFGAPSTGYWPLLQLSHEFGHNVQSRHTHCVPLDAPDAATYGRSFVDSCYGGEGGCFAGLTGLPSDGAGNRGTIMSYCHLLAGGGSNLRFTFGQSNEASHEIVDNMRSRLDVITPAGLSAITAPALVGAGVTGQAASVTNTAGLTYDWTITNGTFTGGGTTATGASVTFTGTTNPVTLRVTATNTSGCSITDSRSVTVGTTISAPANVVATAASASSVTVTWSTVTGAASYNVYRSTNGINFTLAGNPTGPPFADTGRDADTAYVYKVRAVSGGESADSNRDFAVTTIFTDSVIGAASTPVKAVHFTELTTAANALRIASGLGAMSFSQGLPLTGGPMRRSHVVDLRAAIDLARTTLGFSAVGYTSDPSITAGTTSIKKAHLDELRNAVR
jgi:Metallo-peptidase family M12